MWTPALFSSEQTDVTVTDITHVFPLITKQNNPKSCASDNYRTLFKQIVAEFYLNKKDD